MATTTPSQSFPIPESTDDPNIPEDITNLALAIERRVMGVYASGGERDIKVTAPQEGQVAFLRDTNAFTYYDGAAWVSMLGSQVNITSGTAAPSGGSDGDIYLKV